MTLLRGVFDFDSALNRISILNKQVEEPDLWLDVSKAQKIMQERNHLQESIEQIYSLQQELEDNMLLLELAAVENSTTDIELIEQSLKILYDNCEKLRIASLLNGEADNKDCFLEIHAGVGGTESQDWALMLQRMYLRWADSNNYKTEIVNMITGEEAGIKSCIFKIKGLKAYGWLKTESGVHRLVRISPFNTNAKRHTSFAAVKIFPVIDEDINIIIADKDLRIDTYRASGAGGQHINTTDSAVRITHIPTNTVVQCQNERSQHKNKAQALSMLKAKLYDLELQKKKEQNQNIKDNEQEIGWSRQIRSYVMHPYQMVKDLRTNFEHYNVQAVLDGDINKFLEAALVKNL